MCLVLQTGSDQKQQQCSRLFLSPDWEAGHGRQNGCLLMPVIIRLPGTRFSGIFRDRTKQDFQTRDWEQLQGVGALNKWRLDFFFVCS